MTTEFCERFSFYGMKSEKIKYLKLVPFQEFFSNIFSAVLALFFKEVLNYDDDLSTVLYHAFTAVCYFTPLFGAILADSFVGKFRTIFYLSIPT